MTRTLLIAGLLLLAGTGAALAQTTGGTDLNALVPQAGATATGRIVQVVGILTVLSIAPGLLVMVTSFTRFAIAFSFLRSGLGLQTTPANLILAVIVAVHDLLRHGADLRSRVADRPEAADRQPDQRERGVPQDRRPRSGSSCWLRSATRI